MACETERKRVLAVALAAVYVLLTAVVVLVGAPSFALAQSEAAPTSAGEPQAAETSGAAEVFAREEAPEAEEHEGGVLEIVARLVNFGILAGTLVYLLRSPFAAYLRDRGAQIRSDLVSAAEMRQTASAQIEEIDRKMRALPGELDALRTQGAQAIAAEEANIRAAAAVERDRLLEQARREIDRQVMIAERALVNHAADLAVGVAGERIKATITDEDQKRLTDRYVQQLRG